MYAKVGVGARSDDLIGQGHSRHPVRIGCLGRDQFARAARRLDRGVVHLTNLRGSIGHKGAIRRARRRVRNFADHLAVDRHPGAGDEGVKDVDRDEVGSGDEPRRLRGDEDVLYDLLSAGNRFVSVRSQGSADRPCVERLFRLVFHVQPGDDLVAIHPNDAAILDGHLQAEAGGEHSGGDREPMAQIERDVVGLHGKDEI